MVEPYYSDDHVTIYHGDCLNILPLVSFDVVVCDPPYGIQWRSGGMPSNYNPSNGNTRTETYVISDADTVARDAMLSIVPGTVPCVVFGSWKSTRPANVDRVLVWDKQGQYPGPVNHAWYTAHEEIYLIGRGWVGPPTRSVLTSNEHRSVEARKSSHPTSKPEPLMRTLVGKCPPGIIVDPFMGSGSTLRAAKDLGRKAIGIEIEERYCEIAARRMGQEVLCFDG